MRVNVRILGIWDAVGRRLHIMASMDRIERLPRSRERTLSLLFYGGLALLLTLIMTKQLPNILPKSLARPIGYDSEGFFLALVLAAWIQFGCWRLSGRRLWSNALILATVFAGIGVFLIATDLPSSVKTLNEASLALAVLIPFVALQRPLGRWPLAASLCVTAAVAVGAGLWPDSLVVNLAETMVALIIAPWAFDLYDRGILDREARASMRLRLLGYGLLIAIPTVVVMLGTARRTQGGVFNDVLHYLGRSQESFVGILLVTVFLAIGLGARGRAQGSPKEATPHSIMGRSRTHERADV